jgi:hypothetical protein
MHDILSLYKNTTPRSTKLLQLAKSEGIQTALKDINVWTFPMKSKSLNNTTAAIKKFISSSGLHGFIKKNHWSLL